LHARCIGSSWRDQFGNALASMGRVLTVYFSRTGATRKVAEEIQARCGGELEPIEDVRSRAGILGYLRSAREALQRIASEIRPATLQPGDFDLVILGTPVWAGHMSSPLRAYLDAHQRELKRVAFFCTLGGSGAANVFTELTALCERTPVATVAVTDAEIKQGRYGRALDEFAAALGGDR
jgi:flavodoxin